MSDIDPEVSYSARQGRGEAGPYGKFRTSVKVHGNVAEMAKPLGLFAVLDGIIDPLVRADGGELYVADVSPERVVLHLRGRFSGCPGNALAIRTIIEPALTAVAPRCAVVVSAGELVPAGALPWSERRSQVGQG